MMKVMKHIVKKITLMPLSASQKRLEILEGRVYISLGCEYNSRGDFRKAVEFYQQGLAIAKEVGDKELQQAAYWNLGTAYYSNYDFPKAIEFHQKNVSVAN